MLNFKRIKKIKILTENNDALNIKVESLEKKVDRQENEIDELKEDNSKLKRTVSYFENLFDRLVKFIKNRIFSKEKEREDYMHFSKELYEHGIFNDRECKIKCVRFFQLTHFILHSL